MPKFIVFIRNNFRHNLGKGVGNVPSFPPFPKISKFQAALWFREFFCNIFSSIMKISHRIDNFSETIDFWNQLWHSVAVTNISPSAAHSQTP